jgi:hypothetical protein
VHLHRGKSNSTQTLTHLILPNLLSRVHLAQVLFVAPAVPLARRGAMAVLGWRVLERPVPLNIEDIGKGFLKEHIDESGCCGANELIKLWAFTPEEYHRQVSPKLEHALTALRTYMHYVLQKCGSCNCPPSQGHHSDCTGTRPMQCFSTGEAWWVNTIHVHILVHLRATHLAADSEVLALEAFCLSQTKCTDVGTL